MAYLSGDDGFGAASTWQDRCRQQGGVPTVDPKTGAQACRFVVTKDAAGKPKTFRYVDVRTFTEQAQHAVTIAGEKAAIAAGKLVAARDTAKTAVKSVATTAAKKVASVASTAAAAVGLPVPKIVAPSPVPISTPKMSPVTGGTWQDRCRAQGGIPTVDPKSGVPACKLPDPKKAGAFTYTDLRTVQEKLEYGATLAKEKAAIVAGKTVEARDAAIDKLITAVASIAKPKAAAAQSTKPTSPATTTALKITVPTSWQERCRAQGGVATVDPITGVPACRLPNTKSPGTFAYTDIRSGEEKAQYARVLAEEKAALQKAQQQTAATKTWQDRCRAQGGISTVDPTTGAPACKLPDARKPGAFTYTDIRNVKEKLEHGATIAGEKAAIAAGKVVQAVEKTVERAKGAIKASTRPSVDETGMPSTPGARPPLPVSQFPDVTPYTPPPLLPTSFPSGGGTTMPVVYDGGQSVATLPASSTPDQVSAQEASLFGGADIKTLLMAAAATAAVYVVVSQKPKKRTTHRKTARRKR